MIDLSNPPVARPAARSGGATAARPAGRWLALARAAWLALAAVTIGLIVAGIPILFAQLHVVCAGAGCAIPDWQPTPEGLRALEARGFSLDRYAALAVALNAASAGVWLGVGAIIFRRRSHDPMALFAAFFLLTVGATVSSALLRAPAALHPAWRAPALLVQIAGDAAIGLFFYVFPDGRFVPRWTRWVVLGWIVSQVPTELFPRSALDADTWPPALFLPVVAGFFCLAIGAQTWRYRRVSGPVERQQTKWVVYGLTVALGGHNVLLALEHLVFRGAVPAGSPGFLLGTSATRSFLLLIPLSIGVAALRYRLYDIDVLINRTLVYGGLTACVVGLYVGAVGYLSTLFRIGSNLLVSLVATGLVAVLFQPLRERLQRGVNRLLYGERDEPYTVLSRLSRRLEASVAPEAALKTIVQTVREALKLPYAAVALRQGDDLAIAATAGTAVADPLHLALVYGQEPVGELILAPRVPGEGFSPADRRLLDDLARQAGVAAHAVQLTADLQRARERLVAAREEERRRLRRDLHDGLGPLLGSQALTIDAARKLVVDDPATAVALLDALRAQSQTAVADIRRLVYALRPPALDDLGLVSALREQAAHYGHDGLAVTIDAPEDLPPLPAAVEVAVYRIAQEALTNVARHAGARRCAVCLTLDERAGALCLEVRDDGRGLPADRRAGVGTASMRERAEELGGTCVVESRPGEGTRVRARLPLPQADRR